MTNSLLIGLVETIIINNQ